MGTAGLFYKSPFTKNQQDAVINALTTPSASNPFITLSYLQNYAQGFNQKPNAQWATTAPLAGTWTYNNTLKTLTRTTNGALPAQDGITPALNDIGLIKNQVSSLTNGLYTVTQLGTSGTPTILTRQINMDISSEFNGATITVNSGTTQSGYIYLFNYVSGFVMGTDSVNFTQINSTAGLLKADGTTALTANWNAGAFSITANGVVIGGVANTISSLSSLNNGAGAILKITPAGYFGINTGAGNPNNTFVISNNGNEGIEFDVTGVFGAGTTGFLFYNRGGAAYIPTNFKAATYEFRTTNVDGVLSISNPGVVNFGVGISMLGITGKDCILDAVFLATHTLTFSKGVLTVVA